MNTPTHQEVTERAYQIWEESGRPFGRDTEFWLKAEQQLSGSTLGRNVPSENHETARTTPESRGASVLAERMKEEMAAESTIEYNISPAVSQDAAIQAALQKKEARTPQRPTKSAPHAAPPESGKPLWSQPHSA